MFMFFNSVKEADSRTVKYKGKTLFYFTLQSKHALKPLLKCLDNKLLRLLVSALPKSCRREYALFGLLALKRRLAAGRFGSLKSGRAADDFLSPTGRPLSILMVGVGGGIGDMLILLAWAKELYKQASFDLRLDAFGRCFSSHLVEHLGFINRVYQPEDSSFSESAYDLILRTTPHFIYPIFANSQVLSQPGGEEFCSALNRFTRQHYKYYDNLPRHDGSWSRYCSVMGWNRWDEYGASGAIDFSRDSRGLYPLDSEAHGVMERFGLTPGSYITLHAGFDATYKINSSTKVWPLENWEELIRRFKAKYPDFSVVQVGAENSLNIGGTDLSLLGRTSFREAAVVLKHSALHVDGESGLVHLRHIFGGQSVVLFGPTPAAYFSYSENINLVSEFCHDCMWLTDDWFVNCPKGLGAENCMAHISPERVMAGLDQGMASVLGRKSSRVRLLQPAIFSSPGAWPDLVGADLREKCGLNRSLSDGSLTDEAGLLFLRPKDRLEYGYVLSQLDSNNDTALAIAQIGGGRGALGAYLASSGHQVKIFDLDFKEEGDESASRERAFFVLAGQKGFEAELASPLNLPCGDEEFDLVCCSLNLEAAQVYYILKEALRVLKNGGRLILTLYAARDFMTRASGFDLKSSLATLDKAVNMIVSDLEENDWSAVFELDPAEAGDKLKALAEESPGPGSIALGGFIMEKRPGPPARV